MSDSQHLALHEPAPQWFERAIAAPYRSHCVQVKGCDIRYLTWTGSGPVRQSPGLLLVHGGGAHAHWWRFVAPYLCDEFEVAALDLSGMGDSGWRDEYSAEIRVEELKAVLDHLGMDKNTYVVGHSLGGIITMKFGATYGDRVNGVVIVDSPVVRPTEQPPPPPPKGDRPHRIYATVDMILERFRVLPEQPCANDYIVEFIARHSIRAVEGGWQWKFDPASMRPRRFGEPYREHLRDLKCRGAMIHGEKSAIVSPSTASYMQELMGKNAPLIAIPEAYHHVWLDQPHAFVAALRALLGCWTRD